MFGKIDLILSALSEYTINDVENECHHGQMECQTRLLL